MTESIKSQNPLTKYDIYEKIVDGVVKIALYLSVSLTAGASIEILKFVLGM